MSNHVTKQGLSGLNGNGVSDQSTASTLPACDIYHLLSNQRRLMLLEYLAREGHAELNEIVDHVHERECELADHPAEAPDRHAVYVSLYQTHLPRLNDCDVVAFERRSGTIELGEAASQILPYLTGPQPQTSLFGRLSDTVSDALGV